LCLPNGIQRSVARLGSGRSMSRPLPPPTRGPVEADGRWKRHESGDDVGHGEHGGNRDADGNGASPEGSRGHRILPSLDRPTVRRSAHARQRPCAPRETPRGARESDGWEPAGSIGTPDIHNQRGLFCYMPFQPTLCLTCRTPFTPRRVTARYCDDACRKAAQRRRDRGLPIDMPARASGVAAHAIISVTGYVGMDKPRSGENVTLTRPISRPPNPLPASIVRDVKYPSMYRLRLPAGGLSDMVNLTRAKDAVHCWVKSE
jgi:hypothetical protein